MVEVMVAMSDFVKALKRSNPSLSQVYEDPDRQKMFSKTIHPENILEGVFVGWTDLSEHVLGSHEDVFNDGSDPNFGHVVCVSRLIYHEKKWKRMVVIAYGKESVAQFMGRWKYHKPVLEKIKQFFDETPTNRKNISSALLCAPDSTSPNFIPGPHMNKCLFYSAYTCIYVMVLQKYSFLHPKKVEASLLFNVISSESPYFFYHVCRRILADPKFFGEHIEWMDSRDIGWRMYSYIFDWKNDLKVQRDRLKEHLKETTSLSSGKQRDEECRKRFGVPSQRHAPTNNTRASRETAYHSIDLIYRLGLELWAVKELGQLQEWHFSKAVAIIAKKTESKPGKGKENGGVAWAGELLAQHILGCGALNYFFPGEFLQL